MITVRDGFLFRALPFFNGVLAFLPACGASDDAPADTDTATGDESSSTSASTTSSTTQNPTTTQTSEETTDPTTETTLDSSETGEPGVCPEGSLCGSEPPDGWFGPTIIARVTSEETAPECPEDFPDAGPDLLEGFAGADPANCYCECESPASPNCYANLRVRGPNSCVGYIDYLSVDAVCQNFEIDDAFSELNVYGYNPGMCTAEQSALIPPISWDASITTCGLTGSPLSCEGNGLCIPPAPEGFESVWCIYQQGDVGCPAGIFNTKHVFFSGATDSRECGNCTCASTANICNEAELLAFTDLDCAGEPAAVLEANGSCLDISAQSIALQFPGAESCPVQSEPQPMGTADPTGEFTFCCTG